MNPFHDSLTQTNAEAYRNHFNAIIQLIWAKIVVGAPTDIFERKCAAAISKDSRIKLLGLSIREMSLAEHEATGLPMHLDMLIFRFKGTHGPLTEIQSLDDNWPALMPGFLHILETQTYQRLQSAGFIV